jgi:outer membrane receptor protein involved in Fe transport
MTHPACRVTSFAVALITAAATARAQPGPAPDEDSDPTEDADLPPGEIIELAAPAPRPPAASPTAWATRDEIETLPGGRGDALEAVRTMPGVAFADGNNGSGDLVIRGTAGSESCYLVDGIPVPQAAHFGNVTAVLPAEMIELVELSPGGFDVAHGRATGGVIEIQTRSARADAWRGFADLSFVHASAFAEGPLVTDSLGLAVGVRRSLLEVVLPMVLPDDGELSFRDPPSYADAQLRLDWTPTGRHHVSLLTFASDDQVDLDLAIENPQDPALSGHMTSHDRFVRAIASARYDGDRLRARGALATGAGDEGFRFNDSHFLDVEVVDVTARVDLVGDLARWLVGRGGLDLRVVRSDVDARLPLFPGEGGDDPNLTTSPTFEADEILLDVQPAAYVAADVRLGPVGVTPGLRVDNYRHIGDTVVAPRLAAAVEVSERWTLGASVGRFSRPHDLAEQLPTHLDAERAIHATASVERRARSLRLRLTGFATWLDRLVVVDPSVMSAELLDQYQNRGTGTVRGGELLVHGELGRASGWLAYTYARSRRDDGLGAGVRRFDYDQPHNLVAVASWAPGRWRFGGRFRLASGLPYTPVQGSIYDADHDLYQPVQGRPNSGRLDASHQLDLRIDRRFRAGSIDLSVYVDVANVYANPRTVGTAYDFSYQEHEPVTDLPIMPSLGVRGAL